jgi:hypothetical protein
MKLVPCSASHIDDGLVLLAKTTRSVGVVKCFWLLEEDGDNDGISKTFETLTTFPLASTIGLNSTNLL